MLPGCGEGCGVARARVGRGGVFAKAYVVKLPGCVG